MLREIGLFDEDFFAYYEDVDISFRAQLAGWKVSYVPAAKAYTKSVLPVQNQGFTTYQTTKNLPWLLWKKRTGSVLIKVLHVSWLPIIVYLECVGRNQAGPAVRFFTDAQLATKKLGSAGKSSTPPSQTRLYLEHHDA